MKPRTRTDHPLIEYNPAEYYKLARRFNFLPKNYKSQGSIFQIIEEHRTLFRVLRYQFYSLINIATGLDQILGPPGVSPSHQLSSDPNFEGMTPPY
jgi:hypothetical protein